MYRILKKKIVWGVIVSSIVFNLHGQQLDQIGKKGGVRLSGGLGLSSSYYLADAETNRQSPFLYSISGNLDLNLYGWSLPFTVSYSNRKFSTGQPFNIVGVSPTYKSLTMHIGVRNMTFSPYTLAGHSFLGGGLEYSFSKVGIAVKAMGGRFMKAIEPGYDSIYGVQLPSFARVGGGLMLSYTKNSSQVAIICFHAQDIKQSLAIDVDSLGIVPQSNTVYSLSLKKSINSLLTVYGEAAFSGWTKNTGDSVISDEQTFTKSIFFIPITTSTFFYNAYKAGLDLNFKVFSIGTSYQRVEPEFHTLGVYNVASDFENVTLNASTALFKKNLTLSGSFGLQRDDLNKTNASSMNRFVGSANVAIKPNEKLQLTFNYSGFNAVTKVKSVEDEYIENTVYDQLDTMNYIQVTSSVNGSVSYKILENDKVVHSVSDNASYQKADSEQGDMRFGNSLINNTIQYMLSLKETGVNLGLSMNVNRSFYEATDASYLGVGITTSVPAVKKKLRISLGVNGSNNYENGSKTAMLYSVNNSYSLRLGKSHSFSASVRYSGRQKFADAEHSNYNTNLNEFTFALGYKYNFALKRKEKVQ
ncbi:MAG: hypothetical protein IPO21_15905 [Bacteroidales bacterium]|nr:hypothetical protein [Bacteroidales bacterium]